MNRGWIYRDRVSKSGVGQTVLQYYTQRYRHSSKAEWRDRIDSGQIKLDGYVVGEDTILNLGQLLEYHRSPWQEAEVPLSFNVLYEDEDLLAVEKPAGLPVMPGGGFLEHTLLWQLKQKYPQDTPVPIHRLGRGTSGLLLLGRSSLAKSSLSYQMRESSLAENGQVNHKIKKLYRALIRSDSIPNNLTICHRIGKIPHPILGYIYGATPTGKFAQSECRVLQRDRDCTIVEVTILTGRPHQIRIHLAAAGYPLIGDPLYGVGGIPKTDLTSNTNEKIPVPGDCGYYLHAYQLSLIHPRTQQKLNFVSQPPKELRL